LKKLLLKDSKVEDALQKLDKLTLVEGKVAIAQILGVVHGLVGNVRVTMKGTQCLHDLLSIFF